MVEQVVTHGPEGERTWASDGQRMEKADYPYDRQWHVDLAWCPVPQEQMRRAARRNDQPRKYRK